MKKLLTFFAVLLLAVTAWTQNPKLTYQAVVRDNANRLVTNSNVDVTISVLRTDNSPQYTQGFSNVPTNQNGLFSLLFGGEAGWDDVSWLHSKIAVAITLPDLSVVKDTTEVNAVPLAINTMSSQTVDPSSLVQSNWSQTDPTDPSYIQNKPNIPAIITSYIDSSKHYVNSIITNIDTNSSIQSQIVTVVNDTLQNGSSALNHTVDTIVLNTVVNYLDTATSVPGTEALEALANRVDVFNTHVCDSVAGCLGSSTDLQNAINNFLDSSSVYHQNFIEDFTNYTDSSSAYNNALATDIHNYIDSSSFFDQSVVNDITSYIDSSSFFDQSVVNNINSYLDTATAVPSTEELEALANRVDVFNTHVCDSVAGCLGSSTDLQNAINNFLDSSSVYQNNLTTDILNYLSDNHFLTSDSAVITTMQTGISTNTSNIAGLQSALNGYAKLNEANTFTGSNDFTGGTTTVASGFTFGTTTTETCGNVAVNACDLLNVFDSLYRRMSDIQENLQNQIDSLKGIIDSSRTAPVILGVTGTPHSTSIDVAARISFGGSPITSREFCYSTTSDIASATCVSATGNEKTLEGLTPNTEYYIWVKATNEIGTSTSEPVLVKTLPDTPTMSNEKVSASDDHVTVSADIDLKGADDAQLTLCYVEAGTTDTSCLAPKTVTGTAFSEEILGLDTNKTYTIVATLDNGADVPATFTVEATTLALKVTSDTSATVKLYGGDTLKVTYTATIANPDNYTYAWKVNGADSASATGNTLMVNVTTANSYKVTCVATNTADASVSAKDSVTTMVLMGDIPSMVICTDCHAGKAYIKSVAKVNSASWKLGGVEKYNYNTTGTYTIESGTYTVEVKSADGCAATYENITIDKQYTHCTVNAIRDNESGTGTQLDSVKDHEGNVYRVVQIGTGTNAQCWLAENMRAKTEPNGTPILQNPAEYNTNNSAKYAYYYGNSVANYAKYGCLYTWPAAMNGATTEGSRGICPEGWHVPTDGEWTTLTASAGVGVNSGYGAGKLAGGCDWSGSGSTTPPNSYAYGDRNGTGFYALPAGFYYSGGGFTFVGGRALFWSSTPKGGDRAYFRNLYYNNSYVGCNDSTRDRGFSVRCLRD